MDVLLAIILSLIAARLGYLGVMLTMYPAESEVAKKRYKKAFIVWPLLATGLIVWQAVLTHKAQTALQTQLSGIANSIIDVGTEIATPRKNNNEPPLVAHTQAIARSHIRVTAVDFTSADSDDVIRARVHFENDGDVPITDLRNCITLAALPFSNDIKTQTTIEDNIFQMTMAAVREDCPIGPNQVPAHSISLNSDDHGTHPLTPDLYGKVKRGEYAIYLVGRIEYRDSKILRHSDYCYWTKGDVNGMELCFVHNEEP
jgi:hypothetical protein